MAKLAMCDARAQASLPRQANANWALIAKNEPLRREIQRHTRPILFKAIIFQITTWNRSDNHCEGRPHGVLRNTKKKKKNCKSRHCHDWMKWNKTTTFSFNMCKNDSVSREKRFRTLRGLRRGHLGIRGEDEAFEDIRSNGHVCALWFPWQRDSMNGLVAKCICHVNCQAGRLKGKTAQAVLHVAARRCVSTRIKQQLWPTSRWKWRDFYEPIKQLAAG